MGEAGCEENREAQSRRGGNPFPANVLGIVDSETSTSMPWALVVTQESFFEGPLLQVPDEVPIRSPLLLSTAPSSASLPTGRLVHAYQAIRRRWIIGRARLEPDRRVRVEMAGHPLDRRGDAALLLLHGGCSLPRPHRLLVVHIGLGHTGVVRGWHLSGRLLHSHLTVVGLGAVRWGSRAMAGIRRVHVVGRLRVERRGLGGVGSGGCLLVLRGLRGHASIRTLGGRVRLSLSGLGPLLAQCLGLLLLLGARRRRPIQRARLQIHRWHELSGILLLRDERVQLRLLRGPSLQRVDRQEPTDKIDKGDSVVHLCKKKKCEQQTSEERKTKPA